MLHCTVLASFTNLSKHLHPPHRTTKFWLYLYAQIYIQNCYTCMHKYIYKIVCIHAHTKKCVYMHTGLRRLQLRQCQLINAAIQVFPSNIFPLCWRFPHSFKHLQGLSLFMFIVSGACFQYLPNDICGISLNRLEKHDWKVKCIRKPFIFKFGFGKIKLGWRSQIGFATTLNLPTLKLLKIATLIQIWSFFLFEMIGWRVSIALGWVNVIDSIWIICQKPRFPPGKVLAYLRLWNMQASKGHTCWGGNLVFSHGYQREPLYFASLNFQIRYI